MLAGASRSWAARAIRDGGVRVDGEVRAKPSFALAGGEVVSWPGLSPAEPPEPGPVPFDVLHRDDHLAVVAKPWGVVAHSGAGTRGRTLAEGLLHEFGDLPGPEGRAGLVHRLDRGTHGLMVVALAEEALATLQEMVRAREVRREYLALAVGDASSLPGEIETPYGRHPGDRKRFTGREGSRRALTRVLGVEAGEGLSWVRLALATGRTHQVRVHLAEAGHPVVNDPLYANRAARRAWEEIAGGPLEWEGHALVARRLAFAHPATGEEMDFSCEVPGEIAALAARAGLSA